MKVNIVNIARGSLHDGPGMRTVVYFKGCTLRCLWCHNPESIDREDNVLFTPVRCIGCGRCARICAAACHVERNGRHVFLREDCARCGRCASVCPTDALSVSAQRMELDDVFAQVASDRAFFDATGGGITLSGGECLLRAEAAAAILERAKLAGIHTAVESAMNVPKENVMRILPLVDLFIADIKHMDSARHRELTGAGNGRILDNIALAAERHGRLWIRTPLIPGATDGEDNLLAAADFINTLGGGVLRYELLRYNNLGESKYDALGRPYAFSNARPQTDEEMERLCAMIRERIRPDCETAFS